ncbi:heavy-metal-associated domain-containing protein [Caldithrix abyssi]|nr:heavy-metal-associated domain-containing protein [Caldithrix abyssi]
MQHTRKISGMLKIFISGLIVLGVTQAYTQESKSETTSENSQICVYKISGKDGMAGMTCSGCTNKVKTALQRVEGVISVEAVDLASATATVTVTKKSQAQDMIPAAVADIGFAATLVSENVQTEMDTESKGKTGLLSRIRSWFNN